MKDHLAIAIQRHYRDKPLRVSIEVKRLLNGEYKPEIVDLDDPEYRYSSFIEFGTKEEAKAAALKHIQKHPTRFTLVSA